MLTAEQLQVDGYLIVAVDPYNNAEEQEDLEMCVNIITVDTIVEVKLRTVETSPPDDANLRDYEDDITIEVDDSWGTMWTKYLRYPKCHPLR